MRTFVGFLFWFCLAGALLDAVMMAFTMDLAPEQSQNFGISAVCFAVGAICNWLVLKKD